MAKETHLVKLMKLSSEETIQPNVQANLNLNLKIKFENSMMNLKNNNNKKLI